VREKKELIQNCSSVNMGQENGKVEKSKPVVGGATKKV
jgi:hypothetical protein